MCELTEYLVDAFYRADMKVSMKLVILTIYKYSYIAVYIETHKCTSALEKMDFMPLLHHYHIKSFIMAIEFESPC